MAADKAFGRKGLIAGILIHESDTYLVVDLFEPKERVYFFYGGQIDSNRLPLPTGTHFVISDASPKKAAAPIEPTTKAAAPSAISAEATTAAGQTRAPMIAWGLVCLLTLGLIVLAKQHWATLALMRKYSPLQNVDAEVAKRRAEVEALKLSISDTQKFRAESEAALAALANEIKILTDDHDLLSAGFYKPHYAFADAKAYSERLDSIRDQQKSLIREKKAIICSTEWTVGGSKVEGKKMTDRVIKLGLAAFNVQCDNEILSVSFDNIDRSETKLAKIRDNVDKLLEPNHCRIVKKFYELKLEELHLAYEYEQQRQKEKEEQKELREQAREEEKARRDAERALTEARREEERYTQALEKARADLEKKSGAEREAFAARVTELEALLKAADEKRERAKSMAEQTRKGHVYIISNIGSFGESVFKIGMTRRLDPMDRIWELSDASVPFDFDVHALVQSDDAPALEHRLHQEFMLRRINRINERKEFFRVSVEEIHAACKRFHGTDFHLTLLAEAKEYRQTVALLASTKSESPAA